jgi:molybdopterin-guanine dinucleotide biosynthesis protein A
MGRDKALLDLGSLKLIEWAIMILTGAGLDVWIAGARNPALAAFGPVVPDEWQDAGPLGGVCSALRQTDRDWAVFVTVDQPLMAPDLVFQLLHRARTGGCPVTVAELNGMTHTFPAVVRRDALKALEADLEAGRLGCLAAFRAAGLLAVAAEELAMQDPGSLVERWFCNVNTPEDMEAIKGTLGIE